MTTQYQARTANISEAAGATKQCHDQISEITEGLVSRTQSTLSVWQGPASDAYRVALTKWNRNAQEILSTLDQMSRALTQSQVNYEDTETRHVQALNALADHL